MHVAFLEEQQRNPANLDQLAPPMSNVRVFAECDMKDVGRHQVLSGTIAPSWVPGSQ